MGSGESAPAAVDRFLAVDEQGNLLRVTWRPRHGFLNVSLWRNGVCVETFHLAPRDAARLVSFLATSIATSLTERAAPPLRLVDPAETAERPRPPGWRGRVSGARERSGVWLRRIRR